MKMTIRRKHLNLLVIQCCIALVVLKILLFTPLQKLILSYNLQNYDASHEVKTEDIYPKIVWLMSFPNSGNSFTTHMVRTHSNTSTATNYGVDHVNEKGLSVTIQDGNEYKNGPFLILTSSKRRYTNGKYILTKVRFSFLWSIIC